MVIVFALVALAVLAVVAGLHWYVWRRLVRDTTRGPGPARRAGTAVFVAGPVLMIGALAAERAGAPFWLQRTLAWPGFLWMALALYLLLAVLATEALRPLLARRTTPPSDAPSRNGVASPADAPIPDPVDSPSGRPSLDSVGSPSGVPSRDGVAAPADAPIPDAVASSVGGSSPDAVGSLVDGPSGDAVGSPPGRPSPDAVGSPPGHPSPDPVASPPGHPSPDPVASPPGHPSPDPVASPPGHPSPDPVASPPGRPSRGTGVQGAEPPGVGTGVPGAQGPTRRLVVSRLLAGAATTAAVATVGHGTYGVLKGPRVKRVTVPLAKLPRAAHGFRIAVVSDIHLGPVLGRGFAQRVVDTVNATRPDLIAVVGDLVDGSVKDLGPAAAPLARLSARHGAYFVTGNHEYFSGVEQWIEEVRDLGLHPLQNARTELPYFDLAGVNDVQGESEGQGPDFARALSDRDPARACVLLAHQPVQIHEAVRHGVDLQLSGHTHGGQLWPGSLLAAAANPTVAGLDRYGDTQLYVSRGAGAWGPPTRVGAPSDVTVIELAAKRA
ncbi:metallophosphoesterase [Streptomyces olivaceoviridis]|uniref:metallophosphoesterase n=1 Tax=Streptomyces olivaceoviridis TaxID=1921 RepID=UPI0033D5ECB3